MDFPSLRKNTFKSPCAPNEVRITFNIFGKLQPLYAVGNLDVLKRPKVCIIGSRTATMAGKMLAWQLARSHKNAGWAIVSGLCSGIDEWAHMGAMSNNIAALPYGTAHFRANDTLRILDKGGIALSPFRADMAAKRWTFPIRNKIMVGISDRIILVEAIKSRGALKTAQMAVAHKPVFKVKWPNEESQEWEKKIKTIQSDQFVQARYCDTLNMAICRPPVTLHDALSSPNVAAQEGAIQLGKALFTGALKPISMGIYEQAD